MRTCSPRKAGSSPMVYTFASLSPVPTEVEPYPIRRSRRAHERAELFFLSSNTEELRAASGRAGAAIGASRASRTPECGTLCCRLRGMEALLHAGQSSSSASATPMAINRPTTAGQPYHLQASVFSIPPHAEIPFRLVLDGVEAGHHAAGADDGGLYARQGGSMRWRLSMSKQH